MESEVDLEQYNQVEQTFVLSVALYSIEMWTTYGITEEQFDSLCTARLAWESRTQMHTLRQLYNPSTFHKTMSEPAFALAN